MNWRRKLPHRVPENAEVFVTWRLAGSRPGLRGGPKWLTDDRVAAIVAEAIEYGANVRCSYNLSAWVIMPDHVHMIIRPKAPLIEIMRWLKGSTANRANRILGRTGQQFWQREYWDRWIGPENESRRLAYTGDNTVS